MQEPFSVAGRLIDPHLTDLYQHHGKHADITDHDQGHEQHHRHIKGHVILYPAAEKDEERQYDHKVLFCTKNKNCKNNQW